MISSNSSVIINSHKNKCDTKCSVDGDNSEDDEEDEKKIVRDAEIEYKALQNDINVKVPKGTKNEEGWSCQGRFV